MSGSIHENDEFAKRQAKRASKRRRAAKRRRMTLYTVLIAAAICILLFFTPLFNVKNIEIQGNERLETAVIKQAAGSVDEENLFRVSKKKTAEEIKKIPYIKNVRIKKKIPQTLKIYVEECTPCGYIVFNAQNVIVDETLKVLEVSNGGTEGICEIVGFPITSATPGAAAAGGAEASDGGESVFDTVALCLSELSAQGVMEKVGSIDFSDLNNIKFTYEDRLDVVCGSSLDFSKKVGMFKKAVNSAKLTENSRGTIDISVSGKAIYTP